MSKSLNAESLTVKSVLLSSLRPDPANVRKHDEKNLDAIKGSLARFGQQKPIVVDRSGVIRAGNGSFVAARSLGWKEIQVVVSDLDSLEATAYAIADNRTAELADWDAPALAQLLEELRADDALAGVGFDDEDIDALLAELEEGMDPDEVDDQGPEEPPAEPVTRVGELWLLGDHRLLCGDSTSTEDVQRLMGGKQAQLMATDPPYCVDYTGSARPQGSGKDWSDKYREVDIPDLGDFLRAAMTAALPALQKDAGIYVWHAHVKYPVVAEVFEEFNILRHQAIIWAKPSSTFGFSFYRWEHEPCLFGWLKGHKPPHLLKNTMGTVWQVDWEGKARIVGNEHPTQKPVRLFEIPMEQHTKRGGIVYEPFSGSGSQLIAAQKLGRQCFAMELCPAFVDVAIQRWQKATGKQAVLEGTDQTFDSRPLADGQ